MTNKWYNTAQGFADAAHSFAGEVFVEQANSIECSDDAIYDLMRENGIEGEDFHTFFCEFMNSIRTACLKTVAATFHNNDNTKTSVVFLYLEAENSSLLVGQLRARFLIETPNIIDAEFYIPTKRTPFTPPWDNIGWDSPYYSTKQTVGSDFFNGKSELNSLLPTVLEHLIQDHVRYLAPASQGKYSAKDLLGILRF